MPNKIIHYIHRYKDEPFAQSVIRYAEASGMKGEFIACYRWWREQMDCSPEEAFANTAMAFNVTEKQRVN